MRIYITAYKNMMFENKAVLGKVITSSDGVNCILNSVIMLFTG
jgi:hypothetical protein